MHSVSFRGPADEDLLSLSNLRNTILSSYSNFVREEDKSEQLFSMFTNSFFGSSLVYQPLGANL
jgi:hypothetical protein